MYKADLRKIIKIISKMKIEKKSIGRLSFSMVTKN